MQLYVDSSLLRFERNLFSHVYLSHGIVCFDHWILSIKWQIDIFLENFSNLESIPFGTAMLSIRNPPRFPGQNPETPHLVAYSYNAAKISQLKLLSGGVPDFWSGTPRGVPDFDLEPPRGVPGGFWMDNIAVPNGIIPGLAEALVQPALDYTKKGNIWLLIWTYINGYLILLLCELEFPKIGNNNLVCESLVYNWIYSKIIVPLHWTSKVISFTTKLHK